MSLADRLSGVLVVCVACHSPGPALSPLAPPPPVLTTTTQLGPLAAMGLDSQNLPELAAVGERTMKPLMETFNHSLGARCEDCHARKDPGAVTGAKLVSREMWGYTRDLVALDGTLVYCDSCHQGRLRFLDRSDPDALPRWMLVNYVRKLRHRDGSRVECFNCHGRPFQPGILDKLRRRAPT